MSGDVLLTVFKVVNEEAWGWDGYGQWRNIPVDEATASRLRQELCYARTTRAVLPHDPLSVPCTACNADKGEPCRDWCTARPEDES